jgi:hypothetical protein
MTVRLLRRKSTMERVLDAVAAATALRGVRRGTKWTLGVVGGAATATAVSAAVSSARQRGQQ